MIKAGLPDLVVDSITLSGGRIRVVVRNQGSEPVVDGFRVDLYINPSPAPSHVNQSWQSLAKQGVVWFVSSGQPLKPGATLAVSVDERFVTTIQSVLPRTIAAGTKIYVQVDSVGASASYGNVLEDHEEAGGPYNNISSMTVTSNTILETTAEEDMGMARRGQPR